MTDEPAVIPELVCQLADNSASLWLARENTALSRTFLSTLNDLDGLDTRLDAQLDGLRVAGEECWHLVAEELAPAGPGGIFTAAVLAFEHCSTKCVRIDWVETLIESIDDPVVACRPLSVSLDWIDPARCPIVIERLAMESSELVKGALMLALARRGMLPLGDARDALSSDSDLLVRAACEAAVLAREPSLTHLIEAHMQDSDLEKAVTASVAALMMGSYQAIGVLQQQAVESRPLHSELAAASLFRSLQPRQALRMYRDLFEGRKPTRAAVRAAGAAGLSDLIPFLIEAMDEVALQRLAGEALCEVTGINLRANSVTRKAPENFEAGPTENPEDENTDLDIDEGRPWPDPSAVEAWWANHAHDFQPELRHLNGFVVEKPLLTKLLQGGPQRLRAAAAELLAFAGRPLFDVRAPAFRQVQRLPMEFTWR